ncbi:nucleotide exchange factor GrpE [Nocardia sp. 2]|uniref:Nucleotide exchange factor GrpE n=1 Tax=Nocardia acididurans TaxID=2802282 RepID=A0ABS1MDU5_9NOCA|nr:nucleotide exchange factor GrpE [Nocardia acididurans]MBL1078749.1 nucleotide exchange factor GrpE [Nocardia acididurans]
MTESAAATGHSETTAGQLPDDAAAPATAAPAEVAESAAETLARPAEPTTAEVAERIDDLTRIVARQAAALERLSDDARARAQRERAGADAPLVVELFALYGDALALATTAQSDTEHAAFETFANRVERLLTGRGGQVVVPAAGVVFDASTMEAADVVATADPADDRTVDSVLQPGLTIADRSVRPARVIVRRHRANKE